MSSYARRGSNPVSAVRFLLQKGEKRMYRALYRKWRPQRFEDVVAQRGIVTALRNQIAAGRVGHAYLFTGVRGTGKTTCAKIFAKAVNCLHPNNGDPCGMCEICRGIDNGSILDVVEMDAASNNGVDDIRDLRDETAYTPSACHYKVYIIDEVHMLSTAAFNALLKTLEEPPAQVIFILATTEIQKVPATILSRCQRYDFTRIGPEDIAQRVEYIAGQEGLELTTEGAELIARLEALTRRIHRGTSAAKPAEEPEQLVSGPFVLDEKSRILYKSGTPIDLTQVEFQIMELFFRNPATALVREKILEGVWGKNYFGDVKIVDVNIRRLRMKIEDEPSNPRHIMTVWGYGYRWNV